MEKKKLSDEQLKRLKDPLPKEAIKPHPTKTYLSSIKAIYVIERLNEVFGLGGWEVTNEVVREDTKMVVVKSNFTAAEYGISIRDIFGGNDNTDLGDAYKGACTDALTKIGSYLYIGMDVYKGLGDKGAEKKEEKPANTGNSYNRNQLGTKEKPLLTNLQYKQLTERILAGENDVLEKAKALYSFEPSQLRLLTGLLKQPAKA